MLPLSADHVRALELLVSSPEGCTDAVLTAHGFTPELIAELTRAGLARFEVEQILLDGRQIDVPRIRITDVGRLALPAGPP
jgi:hypothetical protein